MKRPVKHRKAEPVSRRERKLQHIANIQAIHEEYKTLSDRMYAATKAGAAIGQDWNCYTYRNQDTVHWINNHPHPAVKARWHDDAIDITALSSYVLNEASAKQELENIKNYLAKWGI